VSLAQRLVVGKQSHATGASSGGASGRGERCLLDVQGTSGTRLGLRGTARGARQPTRQTVAISGSQQLLPSKAAVKPIDAERNQT
jgi:hypothetical protein